MPNKAFINAQPQAARVFRVIKTLLVIVALLAAALFVYWGVKHGLSGLNVPQMMQGLWSWTHHTTLSILGASWKVGLVPLGFTAIIAAVSKLFAIRDHRTATFKPRQFLVEEQF